MSNQAPCPGVGQQMEQRGSAERTGPCPVCGRRIRMRTDGTAGGHKIPIAQAASLADDIRRRDPAHRQATEPTYRTLWYGRG